MAAPPLHRVYLDGPVQQAFVSLLFIHGVHGTGRNKRMAATVARATATAQTDARSVTWRAVRAARGCGGCTVGGGARRYGFT